MRGVLPAAALFAAAQGTAAAADSDRLEATLAVTINALSGRHEVGAGGVDRLTFAPLPLAELTLRRKADAIRIEGLPPVTFGYGSGGDGAQSTQLSIVNATYRRTLAHGIFLGAGQTLYDQFTTYVPVRGSFSYTRGALIEPIDGSEAQYSRVTGPRFELGRTFARTNARIEFLAAVNPKMHGVQYTRIPTFTFICPAPPANGCRQLSRTFGDPENATQVDFSVRIAHRVARSGEILYGMRYLNYVARYDDFPGRLADRNVGFAPTIGYGIRL